jgi:hypothetical protein
MVSYLLRFVITSKQINPKVRKWVLAMNSVLYWRFLYILVYLIWLVHSGVPHMAVMVYASHMRYTRMCKPYEVHQNVQAIWGTPECTSHIRYTRMYKPYEVHHNVQAIWGTPECRSHMRYTRMYTPYEIHHRVKLFKDEICLFVPNKSKLLEQSSR